jgi:hypothetical protein
MLRPLLRSLHFLMFLAQHDARFNFFENVPDLSDILRLRQLADDVVARGDVFNLNAVICDTSPSKNN